MKIPKNVIVNFRISEKEMQLIQEHQILTGSKSRSDFFRKMILKKLKLS
jgi:hypothetical protein